MLFSVDIKTDMLHSERTLVGKVQEYGAEEETWSYEE
jgi:hypothetical protein